MTGAFAVPYLELRALGFSPRSLEETTRFSADTRACFTADPNLPVVGIRSAGVAARRRGVVSGLVIVALAVVGIRNGAMESDKPSGSTSKRIHCPHLLGIAFTRAARRCSPGLDHSPRRALRSRELPARAARCLRAAGRSRWRHLRTCDARSGNGSPRSAGFFTVVAVFAIVMSWGPSIHARGRTDRVRRTSYTLFYNHVPRIRRRARRRASP